MSAATRLALPAIALIAVLAWSSAAPAETPLFKKAAKGSPEVGAINCLAFAPGGVLLIGDGRNSQILAVDTGDTSPGAALEKPIADVSGKIAGRLGTKAGGIEILDLAVNPASGRAYLAVRKQDDKSHAIITIDGQGRIGDLPLDDVRYARIMLPESEETKISLVTDVAYSDERIVAAGRSNEAFRSRIFVCYAPVADGQSAHIYSAETYHVSHGRWETKAPMSAIIPYQQDGQSYVVGAFSCTPVVKYPIDKLQQGAKVQGRSVLELGSGNRPLDMFAYEKGGEAYVLANTFRFHHSRKPFGPSPYWTVRFEMDLLAEDEKINEDALRRINGKYEPVTERVQMIEPYHGVVQMDKLDDGRALVLRETDQEGRYDLEPLPLP